VSSSFARRRGAAGVTGCLAAGATLLGAGPVEGQGTETVIVKLQPGAQIDDVAAANDAMIADAIIGRRVYLLAPGDESTGSVLAEALGSDERVEWIELNATKSSPEAGTQSFIVSVSREEYDVEPTHVNLMLSEANSLATGDGVVVAVLDTGVDESHPDLQNRLVQGGFDFIGEVSKLTDPANGIDENANGVADEMSGHGTFIAGLIARVAPGSVILPVRVLNDDGVGETFDVAEGIYHAVTMNADVINLSLVSSSESRLLAEAIQTANAAGVMVAAAAGNTGQAGVELPARLPPVCAVAAVDGSDIKAGFASYGPEVLLSAPGVNIASLAPGGGYGRASGSSVSAGIVSAGMAMARELDRISSSAELAGVLAASAVEIDTLNPDFAGLLGAGRIDLVTTLESLIAQTAPGGTLGSDCEGDADGDGVIDMADLTSVLANWMATYSDSRTTAGPGDANADGLVDFTDVTTVITNWGELCP